MRKILFYNTLLLLLISCDNYKNYKLDGMWQLKTVQNADGNTIQVDTIYYSFQREVVFSFSLLENLQQAVVIYGYIDMPSNDKVHVVIDKDTAGNDDFKRFLELSGWSTANIVFDIMEYNNSNLVLFDGGNGKTYKLKKF